MSAADRIEKELQATEYLLWALIDSINDDGQLDNYVDEPTQKWYAQYLQEHPELQ